MGPVGPEPETDRSPTDPPTDGAASRRDSVTALPCVGNEMRGVALHRADALDGRAQIRVERSGGRAHVAECRFKGGLEGSLSRIGGDRGHGEQGERRRLFRD